MNTWKVILATLVIFGAGVITGGLLVSYSARAWRPSAHAAPAADGQLPTADPQRVPVERNAAPAVRESKLPPAALSGPLRKDFLNRLSHELKLSSEQRERIERIVSEGQERTRELWRVERVETWHRIRKELRCLAPKTILTAACKALRTI